LARCPVALLYLVGKRKNVRIPTLAVVLSMVALGLGPKDLAAQNPLIERQYHPWGCFEPGTWKTVRVVTETLDEEGKVTSTSTTETKTTLVDVEENNVTLQIEVKVEVAGKRFDSQPQVVKQGFHGELAHQKVTVKRMEPGSVEIEGRAIPCDVFQLISDNTTGRTTTTIHFSKTVPPYVLKRETAVTDPDSKQVLSETSVEVEALQMPCKVLAEIQSTSLLVAHHKNAKGTTITLARNSPSIPGGIVRHCSKELDAEGRLVRRSILELVDYGTAAPEPQRTGLLRRLRSSRHRKVAE